MKQTFKMVMEVERKGSREWWESESENESENERKKERKKKGRMNR